MLQSPLISWMQMDIWTIFVMSLKVTAVVLAVFLIGRSLSVRMKRIREREDIERRVSRQILTFSTYLIYAIGFIVIMGILGVDITVVATSLGVIGIAVGLAAKDIIANFLSGIFLVFEKAYSVNDVIKINDVYGIVRLIKLRSTQIKTFDGNVVTMPNSKIATSTLINMTSGSDKMLSSVSVKLGYKEDFQKAKKLMKDVTSRVEGVIINNDHDVKFEVTDIGRRFHGLKLTMYFYVKALREPWIKSEVHEKINETLVKARVEFHREAPR